MIVVKQTNPASQSGVSLIELMIGIVIALILMAGVITTFIGMSSTSNDIIKTSRLNTELRHVLSLMTREIQKAGYTDAWDDANQDIRTAALEAFGAIGPTSGCDVTTGTCNCFLYSYDRHDPAGGALDDEGSGDGDGVQQNVENFGFRLSNGSVQIKTSDGTAYNPNNDSGPSQACTTGTWQTITSDDINVTVLTFAIAAADSQTYEVENTSGGTANTCEDNDICLDRRKLDVVISAELTSDNGVSTRVETEVKLLNDRYYEPDS